MGICIASSLVNKGSGHSVEKGSATETSVIATNPPNYNMQIMEQPLNAHNQFVVLFLLFTASSKTLVNSRLTAML